jgi:hypothetical protein
MTYKVVKFFNDLQDNDHPYNVGDNFPRSGVVVSESRLAELAGNGNKQGVPLIQAVQEEKKTTKKRAKKAAE